MDKTIAGLLGAVASLATMTSAQAATQPAAGSTEPPQPTSYADLLAPIPNAVEQLKADDAARTKVAATENMAGVQLAQYYYPYYGYYHHHHHHHHHYLRYHHHHHHHHHTFIGVPGIGGVVIR